MDPKRITLHLLKPVGDRKQSAEVDRVWKVTPGLFSPTVTYVLECKWSIVTKKTLDDFLEVLRWSTDFGVDAENGRDIKKSIVPVFAAGTYNPQEKVVINGEKTTLSQYTYRLNIKLLRPADFNAKMRERGISKRVTAQKVCSVCKDEKEVRVFLARIWENPSNSEKCLSEAVIQNENQLLFEKVLTAST